MGERRANRLNTVIFLYSNYAISKLREYANHFNNGKKNIQIDVETCVLCDGCYCSWHSFRFHELLRTCKHPSRNHCTTLRWIPNRWCCRSVKAVIYALGLFSAVMFWSFLSFSLRRSRSFDLPQSLFSSLALSFSGFFSSISCRYLARVARIMKWAKNTNIHNENKLIASEERKKAQRIKQHLRPCLKSVCLLQLVLMYQLHVHHLNIDD